MRALVAVAALTMLARAPPATQLNVRIIAIGNDFHGYASSRAEKRLRYPILPIRRSRSACRSAGPPISPRRSRSCGRKARAQSWSVPAIWSVRARSRRRCFTTSRRSKRSTRWDSSSPQSAIMSSMRAKPNCCSKQHGGLPVRAAVDRAVEHQPRRRAVRRRERYEAFLAANVIDEATGKTLFPPYAIKYFDAGNGRKAGIAFIGVVHRHTPSTTTATGARGLHFTDEAVPPSTRCCRRSTRKGYMPSSC